MPAGRLEEIKHNKIRRMCCEREVFMAESRKYGRYTDYFYEVEPRDDQLGDWVAAPYAFFHGETDIPGSNYHVGFQVIKKPVALKTEPHFHKEEQYHVFTGSKIPNVFDFDAEIEFYMGDDPDNMEKIIITKPTIIRVPKGVWHCPLSFNKVEKPVFFQAPVMSGIYGAVKKRLDKDGKACYIYEGAGLN